MILGPTACGKTALALELAKHHPVEIISVDSALVYRGMDIGSAKPSAKEMAICPHHLIDIREISESYSAADFRSDALSLIEEIRSRGRIPLLVGGTMLYAKALREGLDELPTSTPQVRAAVAEEAERLGWPAMHKTLQTVDPITAARLSPMDKQRISRALEVHAMTGLPLSALQSGKVEVDESIAVVGLTPSNREKLHERIGIRLEQMIRDGILDEVKALMQRPDFSSDLPSMRAVGYRQAIDWIQSGTDSIDVFLEKAKAATRQLAKHQITWLRSMPSIERIDTDSMDQTALFDAVSKKFAQF